MRWVVHILLRIIHGGDEKCLHNFSEEPDEESRPLGRNGYGWEDKSNMNVKEIGLRVWTGFIGMRTGSRSRLL
jgi:hypothetical protein